MGRGGRQMPKDGPQPPSGPGALSQRTDAQKVARPRVHDPDATKRGVGLQQGDGQMLEAAMGTVPLGGSAPPQSSGGGGGASGGGGPAGGGPDQGLPPWLFDMETSRQGEPVTAGLDQGAGPGSEILEPIQEPEDDAEIVLSWLAGRGVRAADVMLQEIRATRQPMVAPTYAAPEGPAPIEASAPMAGDEIQAEEIPMPAGTPGGTAPEGEPAVDAEPEEVAPTPGAEAATPPPEVATPEVTA